MMIKDCQIKIEDNAGNIIGYRKLRNITQEAWHTSEKAKVKAFLEKHLQITQVREQEQVRGREQEREREQYMKNRRITTSDSDTYYRDMARCLHDD